MTRFLAATALVLGALHLASPAGAQTPVSRGLRLNRDAGASIWIPEGSVRLIGWDRDSLHVEGMVAKGVALMVGGGGTGAKLGIDQAPAGRIAPPANITVYLPRGARVNIRTAGASIHATDIGGWFNSVGGTIRVSGQANEVQAEAIDGSIQLDVTTPLARARTGSGALSVAGMIEDLVASTVSGSLTVTATGLARGRFESVTGAVVIDAPIDRTSSIEVDNHGGSVELRLPPSMSGDFELTSVAGTITNIFDKRVPAAGRQGRGQSLVFVTDAKGARVVVRTFKGAITIRRRSSQG